MVTESKKIMNYRSYGITAVLSLITLLGMLYILKIYPFGDKTFLWADGDQYLSIEHYFGSLAGKNDIFYSWNCVLGGNALSELAYYACSPFNVIFMVFKDHMLFAAHLTAYLKITASSLSFCYCMEYLHRDHAFIMKAALSMCYSLMGYMIFYGWNISWMDGVILLPIIFVGIIKITENKNPLQYICSLSAAIISNFYIGFMLCIGSVIFYTAVLLIRASKIRTALKKTILPYGISSILAAGISSFILIPTYLGLPKNRKMSLADMFRDMYTTIKPIEVLSGIFTGQINSLNKNAPLIYIGILPMAFIVIYFVCHKASVKKKMVYAAMLITFILCFENSFMNVVWHGMSKNTWFNYRYSFILSFVLLLIAYDAYILIRNQAVSKQEYMKAGLILFVLALLVLNDAVDKTNAMAIYTDIIFICLLVALLVKGYQAKRLFMGAIVLQMICCMVMNGYFYLKDCSNYSREEYGEKKTIMADAMKKINDDSFYRMDKSFLCGRCDASLFGYNGVTNYASTENRNILKCVKRLGAAHKWMWGRYTSNMPEASESLLGLKYLLTDSINAKDYEYLDTSGNFHIYKNNNALPVLFPSDSLADIDKNKLNSFELLNEIWKSINGFEDCVFDANVISDISEDGKSILEVTVNNSGSVYIGIPSGPYTGIRVIGSDINKEIQYNNSSEIYYIDEFREGDRFNLVITASDDNYDLKRIVSYTENKEVIRKNSDEIRKMKISIAEQSSSHLEMIYEGDRKSIATTIPYDDGWTVYDNGKKATVLRNWNYFLAFELDETNHHKIELIYRPNGFDMGLRISLISSILVVLYELLRFGDKRLLKATKVNK